MLKSNRDRSKPTMSFGKLFTKDQALGPFFDACADELMSRGIDLSLSTPDGKELCLNGKKSWRTFIENFLKSSTAGQSDRARAEDLQTSLGVGLGSFVRLLDNLVASTLSNVHCDLRAGTPAAKLLRIYEPKEVYALIPQSAGEDAFIKPRRDWPWHEKIARSKDGTAELEITPALYPRFVLNAPQVLFGRDREEFEAHSDFEPDDDCWSQFPKLATVKPWILLDLSNLPDRFWDDADRMAILLLYRNPLHLEPDSNESPPYHLNREKFLDVYIDSEDRVLTRGHFSLRARVREEQQRALVQFREEKPDLSTNGRIVRSEWERRIQGEYFGDQMPSLDKLVTIARFGWHGGAPLPEARRLLQRLIELGLHDRANNLYLVKDLIIFQKRRRTNLQLDTIEVVRARLEKLTQIASGLAPVPPALGRFIDHVRSQLNRMEAVAAILIKYAFRRMISAEAVLISQDRWAVFEPGAYAEGQWPGDFGDRGERGRGIRIEAELDANSSDQLQLSIEAIQKLIDNGTGDVAALEREKALVKAFTDDLLADMETTVELQAARFKEAGFQEVHGLPYAKAVAAQTMVASGQGGFRRGHRYWV